MSLSSFEGGGFVIQAVVPAHRDDNPQPDIAEHTDGLGVLFSSLTSPAVVGIRPGTLGEARKGEVPQHFAQGMDAGTPKADGADRAAGFGDGGGPGFALGDGRLGIPVAVIAQFPDPPGGEKITSPRQAAVELAVRMEYHYALNLRVVGLTLLPQRHRLLHERRGQTGLGPDDHGGDPEGGLAQARMDLPRLGGAPRVVVLAQKGLEPFHRGGTQGGGCWKGPEERQGHRAVQIPKQVKEFREVRFQAGGELITDRSYARA